MVMYKFHKDTDIEKLPAVIYKQLVDELNKCNQWNKLADYLSDELGYSGTSWVQTLDFCGLNEYTKSPAENLLNQLNTRECTVEVLSILLEECHLLRALSIIHEPTPLVITQQPNFNISTKQIVLNTNVNLKCTASGLPPPTYTWYHENNALENETESELNLQVDSIDKEGEYRCLIQQINADGEIVDQIFSDSVYLKIHPTPVVIKTNPQAFLKIENGAVLLLTCEAYSHPEPNYQWFRNNTKLDSQNSGTLTIDNFSFKHEGTYYCYVTNGINDAYSEKSNVVMDAPREKAVAKIALLIANESYDHYEKLNIPRKDVAKLGQLLEEIGYHVICLINLTIDQIRNALKLFSAFLMEGVYGLFYFAGHGFKMQECYMLSTDAPKVALRSDAICESELLSILLPKDPALLVVILDMCQTLPSKESNPYIHTEVPIVNEYKSKNNLRNLIQAYSTSSYRPSYERSKNEYGLYITHLIKYITKDLPVQKVFEKTSRSIDISFRGRERDQIPMFASNVTKAYRFTDAIYSGNYMNGKVTEIKNKFKNYVNFLSKTIELNFDRSGIKCQIKVEQAIQPYLNWVKLSILNINKSLTTNCYSSTSVKKNNLYRSSEENVFHLQNPQNNKEPIVISIEKDGNVLDATLFPVVNYIPPFLRML